MKKRRRSPSARVPSRPLSPSPELLAAYPTLREMFAVTPEMRGWIAARLAAMARHAAVAGLAVTALGCGPDAPPPPQPAQSASSPPAPPVDTPPPVPPPADTPPSPPSGGAPPAPSPPPTPVVEHGTTALASLEEGDPCPDHPGGHVVSAEHAQRMSAEERALYHPLAPSPPATDVSAALAGSHGGGTLDDLVGHSQVSGGARAVQPLGPDGLDGLDGVGSASHRTPPPHRHRPRPPRPPAH